MPVGRAAVVLALLVCGLAIAQTPPLHDTIEVSLVNLDVVVTDAHGRRVRGLTKDDFEVYENRQLQPITHFAEYAEESPASSDLTLQTAARPPASSAATARPRQKRAVALFIERTQLWRQRGAPFFAQLKNLLHSTIRPGDTAMIVTWDRGLMLLRQPATGDLSLLDRAIDRIQFENESPVFNPYHTELADAAVTEAYLAEANQFFAAHGGVSVAAEDDRTVFERRIRRDTEQKLRAVAALTRSLGQIDARRVLVLATRRIPVIGSGAEDTLQGATDRQRNADSIHELIARLSDASNANGVTIYPMVIEDTFLADSKLDPAAMAQPDARALSAQELGLFDHLARDTGGDTASNVSMSSAALPSVSDDLRSYYSLAYRATGTSGARAIAVRTKRADLNVRARTSYVVKSDEMRMEDRVIGELFGEASPSLFRIQADTGKVSARRGSTLRQVNVRIPIRALTATPENGGYKFTFTVYIAGLGLRGVTEPFRETKSFHVPEAEREKAGTSFFTYETQLLADDASRRVAIGVVDEPSKEYALTALDLPRERK